MGGAVEVEVAEEAEEMDVGVEARVVDGVVTVEAVDVVKDEVVPLHRLAINLLFSCCTLLLKRFSHDHYTTLIKCTRNRYRLLHKQRCPHGVRLGSRLK